jgi:serine/threonine protein kinase
MQEGGKVLGQGTFGCAITPPVVCNDVPYDPNSVSKIMRKRDATSEMKEFKIIKKVDPKQEFTIGMPKLCKKIQPIIDQSYETREDITKECNVSYGTSNVKNFYAIIMKNGGVSIEDMNRRELARNMKTSNRNDILLGLRRLFVGLVRMKEARYSHADIKPDNVLYNPVTHQFNIIDFGLMRPYHKNFYTTHPYIFYPYETRLDVPAIHRHIYRNSDSIQKIEKIIRKYGIPDEHDSRYSVYYKEKYLPFIFSDRISQMLAAYYFEIAKNAKNQSEFIQIIRRNHIEKFDVYSMGVTLFRFWGKAFGKYNKTPITPTDKNSLKSKLYDLFSVMCLHNADIRVSAEDALAMYDNILKEFDIKERSKPVSPTGKVPSHVNRKKAVPSPSKCKGKAENDCKPPCKYVKGAKRQYCRNAKTRKNKQQAKNTNCKGKAENDCKPPCKYVKGDKRQYCRKTRTEPNTIDCKGKAEEKCKPPCKYVKGTKRQYCRKTRKN